MQTMRPTGIASFATHRVSRVYDAYFDIRAYSVLVSPKVCAVHLDAMGHDIVLSWLKELLLQKRRTLIYAEIDYRVEVRSDTTLSKDGASLTGRRAVWLKEQWGNLGGRVEGRYLACR
eukprot:791792-Pleurochrysis_carterae.AAC.1